jgi:hypothetical protein
LIGKVFSAVDDLEGPSQPLILVLLFGEKSAILFEDLPALLHALLHHSGHLLVIQKVIELHLVYVKGVLAEVEVVVEFIEAEVGVFEEETDDGRVVDVAFAVGLPHGGECELGNELDVIELLHVTVFDVPDGISHFSPLVS